MDFIQANWALIFGVLFAVSELLAAIPSIKANSVFQMILNALKMFGPKDQIK